MKFTTLCYLERDGKYLMLHRIKKQQDVNQGKWIGVGGKFEEGESPEECLVREVKEETGFTLTEWRFRGIVTFVSDCCETEYMCLYTASGFCGDITECNEGVLEWVDMKKIWDLKLWEGDRIFLQLLADEVPFFSLKLEYQGDELVGAVLNGKPREFFDLLDEDGMKNGKIKERTLVHMDGDFHATTHVWVLRENTVGSFDVLLQKRSKNKDAFPGCYDISSGGHIPAGSKIKASAIRELKEELGIAVEEGALHLIGMHDGRIEAEFYQRPFRNHELGYVYLLNLSMEPEEFMLQEEEVDSVMWIEYETCKKQMEEGRLNHCIFMDEFCMLKDSWEEQFGPCSDTRKETENII